MEIRGLAARWNVKRVAILKQMLKWGFPVLRPDAHKHDEEDAGESVTGNPAPFDATPSLSGGNGAGTSPQVQEAEAEAKRLQVIASCEIAKAREAIEDAAQLRHRTAQERREVRDLRQTVEAQQKRIEALEAALRRPFADRLRDEPSDDLRGMFHDWVNELARRKQGGRQTHISQRVTF